MLLEPGDVGLHRTDGVGIVLVAGQLEKIMGFDEAVIEPDDGVYDAFQPGPLLAEALRALGYFD